MQRTQGRGSRDTPLHTNTHTHIHAHTHDLRVDLVFQKPTHVYCTMEIATLQIRTPQISMTPPRLRERKKKKKEKIGKKSKAV